ncbi:GLPGLI family protein [Sphingobacterium sp. Mn56C]|uniref:GLPGLI family protein n=1 Tax=Sphingobacterium sp. Mn56C TaxID=3395261 RepID=UPI003BC594B3
MRYFIFSLQLFLCINFVHSQTSQNLYKILYDIKYLVDTNKSEVLNEQGVLFVEKNKSYFLTKTADQRDSIFHFNNRPIDYHANIKSKVLRVVKNHDNRSIFHYVQFLPGPMFNTTEEMDSLNWNILTDTMTIYNYKCQKASLEYRGNTWWAWFALDLPIADGPYKFCGLPGLIIKMENLKGNWSFDLSSISIEKNRFLNLSFLEKSKQVSYQELLKESDSWKYNRIERVEATGMIKYEPNERLNFIKLNLERIKKENNDIEVGLMHY